MCYGLCVSSQVFLKGDAWTETHFLKLYSVHHHSGFEMKKALDISTFPLIKPKSSKQ